MNHQMIPHPSSLISISISILHPNLLHPGHSPASFYSPLLCFGQIPYLVDRQSLNVCSNPDPVTSLRYSILRPTYDRCTDQSASFLGPVDLSTAVPSTLPGLPQLLLPSSIDRPHPESTSYTVLPPPCLYPPRRRAPFLNRPSSHCLNRTRTAAATRPPHPSRGPCAYIYTLTLELTTFLSGLTH
jgi:hypothetical protein